MNFRQSWSIIQPSPSRTNFSFCDIWTPLMYSLCWILFVVCFCYTLLLMFDADIFVVCREENSGVWFESMRMLLQGKFWVVVLIIIGVVGANLYYFLFYAFAGANLYSFEGLPHRILLDTDVDTDDLLGLLYLLKLNRSEFNVEVSSDETHKLFQR